MLKPRYLAAALLGLSLSLASAEVAAAPPSRAKKAQTHEHGHAHGHAHASARRRASSKTIAAAHITRDDKATRAAARKKPPAPPPPPTPPESVGPPNEGKLVGGVRLDTSLPYVRIVPAHATIDTVWGLPSLIKMIERSAKAVAKRFPGATLDVGDISRKDGGDINGHHSHESGRDADIGFYAVDAAGKQLHARSFIKFDASLSSPTLPGARFDLARNWLLVQSLLLDSRARVSHIFIAEPLRQSLLGYARSRGVSKALWVRAAVAMMQPTQSLAHDDHMHVRISCPSSMRGSCIELAKNAPSKAKRLAKLRRNKHHVTLRTPDQKAHVGRAAHAHAGSPNRAASAAGGGVTVHAVAQRDAEADADAAEVKDALDEGGAAKITD